MPSSQGRLIVGTTIIAVMLSLSVYNTFMSHPEIPSKTIPAGVHTLFSKWKSIFGITYPNPQENNQRLQVFFESVRNLAKYRERNPLGIYNLTPLADISDTEFLNTLEVTSRNSK